MSFQAFLLQCCFIGFIVVPKVSGIILSVFMMAPSHKSVEVTLINENSNKYFLFRKRITVHRRVIPRRKAHYILSLLPTLKGCLWLAGEGDTLPLSPGPCARAPAAPAAWWTPGLFPPLTAAPGLCPYTSSVGWWPRAGGLGSVEAGQHTEPGRGRSQRARPPLPLGLVTELGEAASTCLGGQLAGWTHDCDKHPAQPLTGGQGWCSV